MARDPDPGAYVFDLVDDDAVDGAALAATPGPDADEDPDGAAPESAAPPSGSRDRRLRAAAPVAALLAIVVGTGFAVDGARDGARIERIRDLYGGVVDVSSPVDELWAWQGAVGPRGSFEEGMWNEVAVLGDLLAFQSGDDLVALDPATGDEAWRLELGEDPDCGPAGPAGWNEVVTRQLVCLTGPGSDRTAMVVGPDGAASAGRVLDAGDADRYGAPRPGPDGTVLRAERVGAPPAPGADGGECTDVGVCTGIVETGRDVRLRAEDARTGEQRWSVTVPFRPTPADQCTNWYSTSWDGTTNLVDLDDMLDADGFGARITGDLVQLYGCGTEAAVTLGGALLTGTASAPGAGDVESLRTGGYRRHTSDGPVRSIVYDADGEVVGEIDGYTLQPSATDGAGPDTLLASGGPGSRLRAYSPDGTPRWDVAAEADIYLYLAQVSGTAMVLTGDGTVRGLDLMTGTEQFTWSSAGPDGEYASGLYVSRAFTDGQSVLLVVETGYGGVGLVALDAVTGELAWQQEGDEATADGRFPRPSAGLLAVDGNLLEITPGGVRGMG